METIQLIADAKEHISRTSTDQIAGWLGLNPSPEKKSAELVALAYHGITP